MIPVLHPADSTSWGSFGRGALSDAISCEVLEERNGQYELEMKYPISGQHYSDLALRMIILAKPNFNDAPQPFRIYSISKPLNGIVTVNAQHLCYDLSGYIDSAFSAVGIQAALNALTANCTPTSCPFNFASDMSTGTGTLTVIKPTSIRALMGGTSGSLIDHWHGEWSYNGYACVLNANRGTDRGVTIRYGKNLTSIKQEENNANVYTGIYPFWYNKDTQVVVTLPEKTVNASGTFGYTKICPVDLSNKFNSAPTESQLRAAAQAYVSDNNIGVPAVNLQLGFIQLEEIKERVDLCDTVHVYFDALGVNASAKCVRTRWNVLADRYSEIELGSIRASIAGTITGIKETADQAYSATSTLADTARTVSEKITGQMGGYVVMNDTDNDGTPDEILIMDTADKETATNIIRMNNAGIAFSQDGYHGTYGTAWSIDGQFVADYITSGVLQANLIRILGTTNFYWDAGNIYIINPNDSSQQIRIGQYDGTHYGIGFTRDGGLTWQTAMDFQGLNVQATGFSKTYISLTPPDPADYGLDTFNTGDVWVESERRYAWEEVGEHTWSWAAQHTWQQLGGATEPNMYTWNGGSWQKIYDGESFTSFETRLTVAEGEIAMAVASVASKGTTYIRLTDPRNDSSVIVNVGDHWIKAEPGCNVITWNKAATMSWNTLAATYDWNSMEGSKEYAWDGYDWVLVSDHGAEVRHSTAIIETEKQITLIAQAQATMNSQLVENTAQLTIQANQIASEVTQRKNGEIQLSSRITQNANSISAEVTRASAAEGTLSSRITQNANSITSEVTRATSAEGTLSSRITQNANSITAEVTRATGAEGNLSSRITQNANSITAEVTRATGAESALSTQIQQTADSIMASVGTSLDGKYTKITGISITSTGVTIAAGLKLQVAAEDIEFVAAQKTLDEMLDENASAASAAQSTADDAQSAASAAQSTADGAQSSADGAQSTANAAQTSANNISNGTTSVPYVKTTGITIRNGCIAMSAGGSFTVESGNFSIDSSGNVTMKGAVTASSGKIAGWDIGSDMLSKTSESGGYEYKVMMCAPSSISESTAAFAIRTRTVNGQTYGPEVYPFFVRYDGAMVATKGEIGGWEITETNIRRLSSVTRNVASTQYGAWMSSPNTIYAATMAFAVGKRNYDGTNFGSWEYPFNVDYSGRLMATEATIKGNITVDSISFSSGVTLNGANITDSTITNGKIGSSAVTSGKIASNAVSYAKTNSGVQASLDNGDAAAAGLSSLTAGSVTAGALKAKAVYATEGITVQGHACSFITSGSHKFLGYSP